MTISTLPNTPPLDTEAEYPSNSVIRRTAAERDVRRKYEGLSMKLAADMQAELRAIERKFWTGGFR